jgi:hypothetical protein
MGAEPGYRQKPNGRWQRAVVSSPLTTAGGRSSFSEVGSKNQAELMRAPFAATVMSVSNGGSSVRRTWTRTASFNVAGSSTAISVVNGGCSSLASTPILRLGRHGFGSARAGE